MPLLQSPAVLAAVALLLALDVMPALRAQSLSEKEVVVPRDLSTPAVFVVGFTKRSREETAAWARRLREEPRVQAKAALYEVVVLDDVPRFIRGMVVKEIRGGVPQPRHDRFLIVTEAAETWRKTLHAPGADEASVMLVARNGAVLFRIQGPLTEAAFQSLLHALGA
jgi:hypothetical protein